MARPARGAGAGAEHYRLDLSRRPDRLCALRLAAHDAREAAYVKAHGTWRPTDYDKAEPAGFVCGTSQVAGRFTGFRNVHYQTKPWADGLAASFFERGLVDRPMAIVEFDFASVARPHAGITPMTAAAFNELLKGCGLKHEQVEMDGDDDARAAAAPTRTAAT